VGVPPSVTEALPVLAPELAALIRSVYGGLMLVTLTWAWPSRQRFFLSERYGGYTDSQTGRDWLHHPAVMPWLLLLWASADIALIAGQWVVPAALLNVVLCRHYFVSMRWRGLLRGMGAPGFMAYWIGAVVFALEFTARHAPSVQSLALFVAQLDFALIILSAGVYKLAAGYARNDGMDFGMANPEWGYWWRCCRRFTPGHWTLAVLNHLAWATEVLAAGLMMVPPTRAAGGLLISVSFLFICTQIRLAWLAEMMTLCGLLFVPAGHPLNAWVPDAFGAPVVPSPINSPLLDAGLAAGLYGYLILLPLAHAGLFYTFFRRARLPGPLQPLLDRYTNFFGIIIWRVFSIDHLNFFIRIYQQDRQSGQRHLLSRYGSWRAWRFAHVAESIVVTTVFTTLKYYSSNAALFESRLRRYARTLPCPRHVVLVFQFVAIRKEASGYAHVPAVEYVVDPVDDSVATVPVEPGFDPRLPAGGSVVHEGAAPGSYAPLA
jgi:hypothetical protein